MQCQIKILDDQLNREAFCGDPEHDVDLANELDGTIYIYVPANLTFSFPFLFLSFFLCSSI